METWVVRMVRSRGARSVGAWTLALLCGVGFALFEARYVRNFVLGPYDVTRADLDAIGDVSAAPRYWVRVKGDKALETGIEQISVRKRNGVEIGRSVTAAYYALVVGNRLLLCKTSSGARPEFDGELLPIPSDVQMQLFTSEDALRVRDRFYTYYLDDNEFRVPGYIAIAGALVFLAAAGIKAIPAYRYMRSPESHPVVARVQRWGDPIGTAVAAERESKEPRYRGGGWALGEGFLVRSSFFSFDLLRTADLLWAYKTVTQHRVNFIPTGKTFAAALHCYGGSATIPGNEKLVDEMLGFAGQRTPWAIFGFSQELQKLFVSQTAEFCAAVEQRKTQGEAQGRS